MVSWHLQPALAEKLPHIPCQWHICYQFVLTLCYVHAQVVAAPTGSGKTGVLELALLRMISKSVPGEQLSPSAHRHLKAIYLAPSKALVQVSMQVCKHPALCIPGLAPLWTESPKSSAKYLEEQTLVNSTPYNTLSAIHADLTSHRRLVSWLQEKVKEWRQRLGCDLRLQIEELTGDTESSHDVSCMESADVICTTPEKFGVQPMLST